MGEETAFVMIFFEVLLDLSPQEDFCAYRVFLRALAAEHNMATSGVGTDYVSRPQKSRCKRKEIFDQKGR